MSSFASFIVFTSSFDFLAFVVVQYKNMVNADSDKLWDDKYLTLYVKSLRYLRVTNTFKV